MVSRNIAKIDRASAAKYLCERIDYMIPEFVTDHSFAVVDNAGKTLAVWTYTPRGKQHWELILASDSPSWCSPMIKRFIFSYAFDILDAIRLMAQTLACNRKARKTIPRFGFYHEGRLRKYHNGQDVLIYSKLREEWAE